MITKYDIQHYLDPNDKGYMSLCDVFRILSHIFISFGVFFIPALVDTKNGKILGIEFLAGHFTFEEFIILVIATWVVAFGLLILGVIISVIVIYVYDKLYPYYRKLKCKSKICKIKVIKFK